MDTKAQIEQSVWNFLRGKGLPEYSTAAVMGNIYGESGFDPSEVEEGTGIGYGLCQWSYTRRTQLEAYGTDLAHQEEFLWSELTGQDTSITGANYQWINKTGYLTHDQFMVGSGSINDLTAAFCFCWERPNAEYAHLDVRQQAANSYYSTYHGGNPPPTPDTGTVVKRYFLDGVLKEQVTLSGVSTGSQTFNVDKSYSGYVCQNPFVTVNVVANSSVNVDFQFKSSGTCKLKENVLYGSNNLFKRRFITGNKTFTIVKTMGDKITIKDGNILRVVNKKYVLKS